MSFSCPTCNVALKLEYGSISCSSCHQTGDPAFWAALIAKARRGVAVNPCAFCSAPTRKNEIGFRVCTQCGIDYHPQIESRLEKMCAQARARFIGHYHAMNEHNYQWMYVPADRAAERYYAQGWLSAPIRTEKAKNNRRLWDKEASRHASMWR